MPRKSTNIRRDAIRRAVAALAPGAQRRYPAELRTQIADYARGRFGAGKTMTWVANELGIGYPTLSAMLDTKTPVRPVRVVSQAGVEPRGEPGGRPVGPEAPPNISVRGPNGLVLEGLSIQDAVILLRALSC